MAGSSSNSLEVLAVMTNEAGQPVQCLKVRVEDYQDEQDIEFLPLSEEDEPLEVFNDDKNTDASKCRICGIYCVNGLKIFGTKGEESKVLHNIKTYLTIPVPNKRDRLPLSVCTSCVEKLNNFHQFVELATATNTVLRKPRATTSQQLAEWTADNLPREKKTPRKAATSKTPITCKICNITNHASEIETHYLNIHSQYLCIPCNLFYSSTEEREYHNSTVHVCTCHFCNKVFSTSLSLEAHLKNIHTEHHPKSIKGRYPIQKEIPCTLCNKKLKSNRDAKRHYFLTHQKYACELCFEIFSHSQLQVDHTKEIHSIPCKYCPDVFYNNQILNMHLESRHDDKDKVRKIRKNTLQSYECKTCNKGLTSILNIKRHNFWSHELHTCDFCAQEFTTIDDLNNHFNEIHINNCYYCNEDFTDLNLHIDSVHFNYNPFSCESCGKFFRDRNTLQLHRNSHIVSKIKHKINTVKNKKKIERTEECEICEKKFIYPSDLKKHMLTHSRKKKNIKSFKCPECDSSLSNYRNLDRHMKSIHRRKEKIHVNRYECRICQENFTHKANLNRHDKTMHADFTLFKCLVCNQNYSSEENVVSHLSFHKPADLVRLKNIYVKVEAMKCNFCFCYFSCKDSLEQHIVRHLIANIKDKNKRPPKISKMQQLFSYCMFKKTIKTMAMKNNLTKK